jgi:hypothetical protein
MTSTALRYVTVEQFVESRTRQDDHLKNEFGRVETRLDHLDAGISTIQSLLGELVSSHRKLEAGYQELLAGQLQMGAQWRNSLLRNPLLKLHAPVVCPPGEPPMFPDSKLFPQNAREFYALRYPKTDRHKRMIHYLARFYNISYLGGDASDPESEGEPTTNTDPIAVVDALESALGLVESNFIEFRESAQRYAEAPTASQKRISTNPLEPRAVRRTHFLQGEKSQAPVALPFRPSSPANREPPSSEADGVGWYLETPSDKARRDKRWKHALPAAESTSNDSSDDHPVQENVPGPANASPSSAANDSSGDHPVQEKVPGPANASPGSATNPFSPQVQGAVPGPSNASLGSATNPFSTRGHPVQGAVSNTSSGSTTDPPPASRRPSTKSQSTGAHA